MVLETDVAVGGGCRCRCGRWRRARSRKIRRGWRRPLSTKAAWRSGSGNELGTLFTDEQFADLFPLRGKPAWSPGRLALVLVLQFVEGLTDRQAAEAVRARIDFKCALGLELTDPGFDFSVLSEFRDRLIEADAGRRVLDGILAAARDKGLLAGGKARTDSTHVLSAVRELRWLELVSETLRSALNALAQASRINAHLTQTPRARTRVSHFAALLPIE